MKKIIRILIAAGSLPTATPLADAEDRTHLRHVVMGAGVTPVLLDASLSDNGSNRAIHIRYIHDSGYNPKDGFAY